MASAMNTDNLTIRDDFPLANSTTTTIAEARPATAGDCDQDVMTIFDVTNEIELALKELQNKVQENEKQFESTLKVLEEKVSSLKE